MTVPVVIHSPVMPIYWIAITEFTTLVPVLVTPVIVIAIAVFIPRIPVMVLQRAGIAMAIVVVING